MYDSKARLNPWLKAFVLEKEQAGLEKSKQNAQSPARYMGFLSCLVRLPDLLQYDPAQLPEIQEVYKSLHTTTQAIADKYAAVTADMASTNTPESIRKFALCQKSYALYLSMELILVGILHVYDPNDPFLDLQSAQLCQRLIELCIQGSVWRPLGSGWIAICLASAWVAVTDTSQRPAVDSAWLECWPYGASHSLGSARALFSNAFDRLRLIAWGSATRPPPPPAIEWDPLLEFLDTSLLTEDECLASLQSVV